MDWNRTELHLLFFVIVFLLCYAIFKSITGDKKGRYDDFRLAALFIFFTDSPLNKWMTEYNNINFKLTKALNILRYFEDVFTAISHPAIQSKIS